MKRGMVPTCVTVTMFPPKQINRKMKTPPQQVPQVLVVHQEGEVVEIVVVDNPEVVEFFDKATRVMEEEMAIQIKEVSPAQNVFTVMKTTPLLSVETYVTKPIRKQSCLG